MNDRYDITRLINKDHAGGVYEGEDTILNRKVNCRRFFDEDGDASISKWKDEFNDYCHKLTSMQHPNIALVYDAGVDEDGAFLISSQIKGDLLDELLAENPLSEYEIYSLAHDVLEAFTMIHSQGETHGALLPKSVIRSDKPGGRYRHHIIDLGIAALIPIIQGSPFDAKNPALTSPEQLRGDNPTPQTDLFMLGQLCYILAAQGHPFSDASTEEAIEFHMAGEEQKDLRSLAPQISVEMAAWVHSLIHADPKLRPESAELALATLPIIPQPGIPQAQQTPEAQSDPGFPQTAPLASNTTALTATVPVTASTAALFSPQTTPLTSGLAIPAKPKSSKKTLVIVLVGVALLAILGVALSGGDKKETPVAETTPSSTTPAKPVVKKKKNAVAVIQNFDLIALHGASKPRTMDLSDSNILDYLIFTGATTDQTKKPPGSSWFSSITKTPGADFKTSAYAKLPVQFKTTDAIIKPKLTALNTQGLNKGLGWEISFQPKRTSDNFLLLEVYFYQSNMDTVLEFYQTRDGVTKKLAQKICTISKSAINRTRVQIKSAQADATYTFKIMRDNLDNGKKPAMMGISAVAIKSQN